MNTVIIILLITILHCCYAPPVTKNEKEQPEQAQEEPLDFIHYSKYLKQVVNVLESDPEFKKKLEEANEDDIKSGKIAHELDFVSHHVRTKLDELKRSELDRLRQLKHQLTEQELNENQITGDPLHGHLDRSNKHTFEIEDLKKLIRKTTEDLAEADRRRREEFKQYELQKEYEKLEKLNHTNGLEERAKLEKEFKEIEEKRKKHEPLHEPGHKAQLEEVWEKQNKMDQEFDPRAFFMMQDVNSDMHWDEDEVEALFGKELDKLYQAGVPEVDLRERAEEMERMRETVFREMDHDKDGLISFNEFLEQTKRNEFEQDHGWKSLDEQGRPYSEEELQEYIKQQHMLHPPQGYPPNYHPNQVPQGYAQPPQYQGQPQPPQYAHPNQPPQYAHPNQPSQYAQHQPQYAQNQPPQYAQPNLPPPSPGHYQQPVQGQPVPNKPPPLPGQQYPQAQAPVQSQQLNQPSPPVNPPLNKNEHVNPPQQQPQAARAAP